jgi:hypothetical protein
VRRRGEGTAQAFGNVGEREKQQDQAETRIEDPEDERAEYGDADGYGLHDFGLQAEIYKFGDLLWPFEDPIEIVKRDEMKTHGAGRGDGMLPPGDVGENDVIAMNADEPVDTTNKADQEKIQRRNAAFFGKFRVKVEGDVFGENGGGTEEVADPDHRQLGQDCHGDPGLRRWGVGRVHWRRKIGEVSVTSEMRARQIVTLCCLGDAVFLRLDVGMGNGIGVTPGLGAGRTVAARRYGRAELAPRYWRKL